MSYTASKVIAVAAAEIGYKEKASNSQLDNKTANAGSANYTKYARDFDTKYPNWYNGKKNGYAWCDMFVDWCFLTAFGYSAALSLLCQPEKSCGAGCTSSAGYYRSKGQFYTSPHPGDQIFFGKSVSDCDHTGIVEKVDGSKVYTIEGNTSNQVARRSYALTDKSIVGYGRPKYDPEESTPQPSAPATINVQVGDIVTFTGGKHYASANAASGDSVKASLAKVTALYPSGKHPVHLRAVDESGAFVSGVYGWVDIATVASAAPAAKKTNEEIAKEVLNGEWGNGQDRKNRIIAAGYDYAAVQQCVNQMVSSKKSIDTVAREVVNGKWGNGAERRCKLESAGYDYAAVQKRVNELLG